MAQDNKKGFVFYYDYQQHLALLTDAERGKLLMALLEYGQTGEEPQLEGAALMAFSFIKAQKDRDSAKYAETCRKRSEAGKQGGRPKKATADEAEVNETEEKQNKANAFLEKQTKAKKANAFLKKQTKAKKADTDTDTDTDTNKDIYNPPYPPKGGTDTQERRFAEFWAEYPKKVGKKAAQTSWKRLRPDAELFEHIMQAIHKAKESEQWNREGGRFVPNPSTWINQGRWDDELTPINTNERTWQNNGEHSGNFERPNVANTSASEAALSGFTMAEE